MLFRTSAEAEARRLAFIGLAVILCLLLAGIIAVRNPFGTRPADRLAVVMDLPYVGQGVSAGTPLMMHGVTVGRVATISIQSNGSVRLDTDLESAPAEGLTTALTVDFRPANYFGVTGINLIPGAGGQPLRDGIQIGVVPQGNFTLQALLSRLGEITGDVVTPQLIGVINRATRITDGLNPFIESMLIVANSVAKTQTVSTEQLLRNTAGISAAFPPFVDDATSAGYGFNQRSGYVLFNVSGQDSLPGQDEIPIPGRPVSDEFWQRRVIGTLDVMAGSFFGALGKLLSSHTGDLLPAVNLVQTVSDTVPGLVPPIGFADTMVELRTRFEKLYSGSPEQRALQVHIVLDQLPGLQAPIAAMGGS